MFHGYQIVLFSHAEGIRNLMSYLQKCETNTYVAIKKKTRKKQNKNSEYSYKILNYSS